MRFLLQVFLIIFAGYLAESAFPWWTAAVTTFIITALIPDKGFKSFLSGFLGLGMLWLFGALYFSMQTDYILTDKVTQLMQLEETAALISATALVGAIVGGMSALSGSQLYRLLRQRQNRKGRYRASL